MPLFTSESAVQFGRLSGQIRRQRAAEAKAAAALPPVQPQDEARKRRVLLQIDRVDDMLLKCSRAEFPALTAAKERLWNLVFPKAGVMRPRSQSQRRPAPSASSTRQETLTNPA